MEPRTQAATLCNKHYTRWWRHGNPTATKRILGDDESRFLSKVLKHPDGCWEWTAGRSGGPGYGAFSLGQRKVGAHRWSYENFVGPIPEGLELDHLCRNPGCVNPDHLEPVTRSENIRRTWEHRR
jgi:hypothetical protein